MSSTEGQRLIVAIDGPSGVGKSTVASLLAERLGVPVLDTGAMYRAVALKVLLSGVEPYRRDKVVAIARAADVEVTVTAEGAVEVCLDGEPVGERIRTPEVSDVTSQISAYTEVRRRMVELQRRASRRTSAVVEGRDIGTVVFPGTPYKFFLTASAEVRAGRRHRELEGRGEEVDAEEVLRDLVRRDQRDSSRADSPLRYDESYTVIDTSELSAEEVVERMVLSIEGTA